MRVLAVPRNRLNAFKKNGCALLKEVAARGGVECRIDEDGNVEVKGRGADSGGREWIAEQVIRAFALGFEPKHAFKLFDDDFFLEVLDLELLLSKSEKRLTRMKARIIGSGGRVKKNIEELSGAHVAVSENRVALLGRYEDLKLARAAVSQLLEGKEIPTVYAFLEKHSKK